jgi:hypothetical protein
VNRKRTWSATGASSLLADILDTEPADRKVFTMRFAATLGTIPGRPVHP